MKLSRRSLFSGLIALALTTVAGFGLTATASSLDKATGDCCCVVEDGQRICTITGEVLDECCCR